jgi:hypothetical protein
MSFMSLGRTPPPHRRDERALCAGIDRVDRRQPLATVATAAVARETTSG